MLEDAVVRKVLGAALATGGEWAEIYAEDRLSHNIRLEDRRVDFWEAGMDMHLGTDLYDSSRKYQWRLIREYNRMARQYGFIRIDAILPPQTIVHRLQQIGLPGERRQLPGRRRNGAAPAG